MKTIIEDISKGKTSYAYQVGKNEQLTLVLLGTAEVNRNVDVEVSLTDGGADAQIIGLLVGKGHTALTLKTFQNHEAPNTTSNLLVKSILSDNATFAYDGGIRVKKEAQKTDAYQRNENLLLSKGAHAKSKPSLEILANDVRCTHGATIGTLSEDELWYLASRGIPKRQAQGLIVRGFFEKAISKISDTIAQKEVRKRLWQIM